MSCSFFYILYTDLFLEDHYHNYSYVLQKKYTTSNLSHCKKKHEENKENH